MTALSLILLCYNEAGRRPATLATYPAQACSVRRQPGPGHPCGEKAHAR